MKKFIWAGLMVLVMTGAAYAAASFVLTNTGRSMAAQGLIAAAASGTLNAGTIEIQDSSNNVLATLTLPNPAGTISNGVLTFGTIAAATATGAGTADHAVVKNAGGTAIGTANVGTADTSIIINNTTIAINDLITISGSITITVPAGS